MGSGQLANHTLSGGAGFSLGSISTWITAGLLEEKARLSVEARSPGDLQVYPSAPHASAIFSKSMG
jgi:hypothetical protein